MLLSLYLRSSQRPLPCHEGLRIGVMKNFGGATDPTISAYKHMGILSKMDFSAAATKSRV